MSYRKQFEKEMNRIEGEKRKKYLEDKYKQLKNKAYILKNDKEAWEQVQQVFKTTKRKMHPAIKGMIICAAIVIFLIILGIWLV